MPSAKELRDELRALRKESVKPISKMRKGDVSAEIERLKVGREETPAVAAVPSAPKKKSVAAVESIQEAKKSQFPVKPAPLDAKKEKMAKAEGPKAEAPKKKRSAMEKLLSLVEAMSDSE